MDNTLFLRLDKLLVDTLTGKASWIKTKVEIVNNELAKKYYFSNLPDIKCVYSNYPSGEVIVLNKKSGAVFFCNDGTERMYKK